MTDISNVLVALAGEVVLGVVVIGSLVIIYAGWIWLTYKLLIATAPARVRAWAAWTLTRLCLASWLAPRSVR